MFYYINIIYIVTYILFKYKTMQFSNIIICTRIVVYFVKIQHNRIQLFHLPFRLMLYFISGNQKYRSKNRLTFNIFI